ncbi:TetR/AcrR family transcriptional regulator [Dactylosporangium fulvum]|uniref:TetR/AcrR family transcriptional regulator n=1 Tax=Dactylosporangium fulvum TaxID=53359 RepID=A0ABY5VW32_9ACTN|nr:TetR/AcrR family transcriptional regulator [Dactylosporangium fulvum]UWP81031.1 TetR/AcrR family transcriptional regulator [Dactylosporangium fulvum]
MSGVDTRGGVKLPGRKGQAARNDGLILAAARDVFLEDPKAPVAAVAERAGVGISALYRRYAGKEDLLRKLCHDGLRTFIQEAEDAGGVNDGWEAFTTFLRGIVDADVHSLTVHLAGTFEPTADMMVDAVRANELAGGLVERAHASGRLRRDFAVADVGLLLEACAAIRLPDRERTAQLRRRYLALTLDGMDRDDAGTLPGPAPWQGELNWRWARSQ